MKKAYNNSVNTDTQLRWARWVPVTLTDGSNAARRAIGAANCHPLFVPALRASPSGGCSGQPSP